MNIDLMMLIEYFIGAFTCCFGSFLIGYFLLEKKKISKSLINILLFVIFTILTIVNSLIFDNIIKIFGVCLIVFGIYNFIYKEKIVKSFVLSIITYIIILFGEATFAIFITLFSYLLKIDIVTELSKLFLTNIIIISLAILYGFIFKKILIKLIKNIEKNTYIYVGLLGFILVWVLLASSYNILFNNLVIDHEFIFSTIIFVGCLVLIIVLIIQYLKRKETINNYKLLENYLKTTADLIEKYSSANHKYDNNLIVLKSYLKSKDFENAEKHIDKLLKINQDAKFKWLSKINYITLDTLKYFIYHKLSKAEELNLKILVDVNKKVKQLDFSFLELEENSVMLEILGEYLNNAIYAADESKEKELNFSVYLHNKKVIFEIANTYKVKFDLNMITKNGYTTKGKNHGFGLYDVDKIIKRNEFLRSDYQIIDKYFVVRLIVDIH